MSTTTVEATETPTLSLLDYLGKPAGKALGAAVYEIAKIVKEPVKLRMVDEPYYKGKILKYRPSFLKTIFTEPTLKKIVDDYVKKYNQQNFKIKK